MFPEQAGGAEAPTLSLNSPQVNRVPERVTDTGGATGVCMHRSTRFPRHEDAAVSPSMTACSEPDSGESRGARSKTREKDALTAVSACVVNEN